MKDSMSIIYSMTGFGSSVYENGGTRINVEIKSVNHRGQKINIRSKIPLGVYEKSMRDIIAEKLPRGTIDVFVNIERQPSADDLPLQEDLARAAIHTLKKIANEFNLNPELHARDLLLVPGLLNNVTDKQLDEHESELLLQATKSSIEQLLLMRKQEGELTVIRIREIANEIQKFADFARGFAPTVVLRARERLRAKLDELFPNGLRPVDEMSLEREICFFADRSDINEELDRLQSHLSQLEKLLNSGGDVGKRLEFLAQEFLREINTSASKANDAVLANAAVEAKLATEKIKEQAANLE